MTLHGRHLFLLFAVLFVVFLQFTTTHSHAGHNHDHAGHGHGHGHAGHHHHHDHDHEEVDPAFKYSKQANQAPPPVKKPQPHVHSHAGHSHDHSGHSHGAHSHAGHTHSREKAPIRPKVPETKPPMKNPWFYALLSTLLISLAPFLILYFIPINANDEANQPLLRIFLSFASGGLLGDAFLHLIPHAIPHSHGHGGGHDHGHGHGHSHDLAEGEEEPEHDHMAHTIVGLWVLAGIIGFLIVEKVIRHLKGGHDHGHSHGGHSHSHTREATPSISSKKTDKKSEELEAAEETATGKSSSDDSETAVKKSDEDEEFEIVRQRKRGASPSKRGKSEESVPTPVRAGSEEHTTEREVSPHSGEIRVSGYLNLAADFAHNFTDGLAIGASFLAGQGIGWITTLTILFHEIPHEIGDFALLIQSGCSKPKAILLQLVTAVGAFMGCLVSLTFGAVGTESSTSPVLAFTAGGFIYIATVSVIPELLSDVKIGQSIKEILALLVGIALMVVIAVYE